MKPFQAERSIKQAVLVNLGALLLGVGLIVASLASTPREAKAYTVYLQTGSDSAGNGYVRICWDFIDPLGKKRHVCSGWMQP